MRRLLGDPIPECRCYCSPDWAFRKRLRLVRRGKKGLRKDSKVDFAIGVTLRDSQVIASISAGPDGHGKVALPKTVPDIGLRLGEVMWVLARMGFQGAAGKSTFYEYLKSLRKMGIPFERGVLGYARRGLANYSYYHLMELALVLTLRVYHAVPDSVLIGIVRHRRSLNRCYRRAYIERSSGLGSPILISLGTRRPLTVRGVFLDLQIDFSGGKLTAFGPPKALSPYAALTLMLERGLAARAFQPINLSLLSERLFSAAFQASRSKVRAPRGTKTRRVSHVESDVP